MRTAYVLTVAGILVVVALLIFPNLSVANAGVNMTEWLPLTKSAGTFLPYAFLLFVVYVIMRLARR